MNKIALFFAIFAVAFACAPEDSEVPEIMLENSVTDYIELVKCLLGNEDLVKDVTDIIGLIKAQDFNQLIFAAIKLYTDGKAAIEKCLDKMLSAEVVILQDDKCKRSCISKPLQEIASCLAACNRSH